MSPNSRRHHVLAAFFASRACRAATRYLVQHRLSSSDRWRRCSVNYNALLTAEQLRQPSLTLAAKEPAAVNRRQAEVPIWLQNRTSSRRPRPSPSGREAIRQPQLRRHHHRQPGAGTALSTSRLASQPHLWLELCLDVRLRPAIGGIVFPPFRSPVQVLDPPSRSWPVSVSGPRYFSPRAGAVGHSGSLPKQTRRMRPGAGMRVPHITLARDTYQHGHIPSRVRVCCAWQTSQGGALRACGAAARRPPSGRQRGCAVVRGRVVQAWSAASEKSSARRRVGSSESSRQEGHLGRRCGAAEALAARGGGRSELWRARCVR